MTKKKGTQTAAPAKASSATTTSSSNAQSSSSSAPPQQLSSKAEALFRNMIKSYEEKQYQTAISIADSILRDHPQHGDTLAMKALLTRYIKEQEINKQPHFNTGFYYNASSSNSSQQQELMIIDKTYKKDCYNAVKRALELVNNKSFICWHVYGLMCKDDFKYSQAITCFQNSMKFNPVNEVQAWRELSNVQIHARDYKGALESRKKLLELKPGISAFWIGYALAQHLHGNLAGAIQTVDKFLSAVFDQAHRESKTYKFEKSEMLLYLAQLHYENGQYKECVDTLIKNSAFLADQISVLERLGECYIKLNQLENAKKIYLQLLKTNSDNYAYYGKYQLACGFSTEENRFLLDDRQSEQTRKSNEEIAAKLYQLYTTDEALKEYREKSPVMKMIILLLAPPYGSSEASSSDAFREHLINFVEPYLFKTIPSLFKTLKIIYQKQSHKVSIIEKVMMERLQKEQSNTSSKDPSVLLWILVYLSQHFDAIQDYHKALDYINQAIEHTPTLVESYMLKAKFYKHLFDTEQAALCMEQARKMDLSDRYLNTKATKYWMRHNEIVKADDLIGIFAKHPKDANAKKEEKLKQQKHLEKGEDKDVNEVKKESHDETKKEEPKEEKDSNLIPIEDSAIYHRNNVHDMQCMWFENECADAHFRKGELALAARQYYYVVQHFMEIYEDQFDFHTYCARKVTMRSYIEMMRYFEKLYAQHFYFHAICGLLNIYLLLLRKKEQEQNIPFDSPTDYGTINASYTSNFQNIDLRKDEDLNGLYITTKLNLFDECTKYLKQLEEYHPNELITQIFAMTIYLKSRKYLLVSKALKKALELSPLDYRVHFLKMQYLTTIHTIVKSDPNSTDSLSKLLQMDYQKITAGKSLDEMNNEYLRRVNSDEEKSSPVLGALAYHAAQKLMNSSISSSSQHLMMDSVEKSSLRDCVIACGILSKKKLSNRPYKKEDYLINPHLEFNIFSSQEEQVEFSTKLKDCIEKHFNMKINQ
ncbi:hypothetical protein FDP41_004489 [Naegleria fowleri]|uniref:Uncharacterized protein n=1 Tax=Naegleria fowleri TaxID=5763 RepID=A0A6A5BS00_NAEFO|nr:uncharacterized protein FDP41_004489 [Naegleria fowleri]KAF0976590.1 hypothetical protein FDP41_004489 [Naegleria fowleri]